MMMPTPKQRELLNHLVVLKLTARVLVRTYGVWREHLAALKSRLDVARATGDADYKATIEAAILQVRERMTEGRFHKIEIGRSFCLLSDAVNAHVPRELWLEALGVNRSEWDTADMREYGDSPLNVVAVANLENSATRDYADTVPPLAECCNAALMNRMKTSDKLDRAAHDAANEFFGGIFGEYRERSPLERMGIPAHMIQGGQA